MRLKQFLIALLLGSSLAVGIFIATKPAEPRTPIAALMIPQPDPLPDFSLLDQHGNPITADSFRGQWDLVFFGFTHLSDDAANPREVENSAHRCRRRVNPAHCAGQCRPGTRYA